MPASLLALMLANKLRWPTGEISTIVLPVPCLLALSLKLLTQDVADLQVPVLCRTTNLTCRPEEAQVRLDPANAYAM